MEAETQSDRWELSAVESLVLLNGPMTSEVAAVRMAIVELVVRRALTLSAVDRKILRIFTSSTDLLSPGPTFLEAHPAPLQEVLRCYRSPGTGRRSDGDSGVAVQDLAQCVFGSVRRRTFIGRFLRKAPVERNGYMERTMLPHLVERGMFRKSETGYGGIFQTGSWVITPEGMKELDRLLRIVTDAREHFQRWVKEEPERAATFVERAGPALLLIPGIAPPIRELHARQPAQNPLQQSSGLTGDPGPFGLLSAPVSAYSLAALAGVFGPGAFDGFDSTLYAISEDVSRVWETLIHAGDGGGG